MRLGRDDPSRPVAWDEQSAADFAALGVTVPDQWIERTADVFEVWEENWRAVKAFLGLETQWRTATIGGGMEPSRLIYLGLDYAAMEIVLPSRRSRRRRRLIDDLRIMEREALDAFVELAGAD